MSSVELTRLIHLRDLVRELVVRDIKLRYKRSVLGVGWSLLGPLAQLAILSFVFGVVLPLRVPHYTVFLFSGLLPWTWFQSSLLAVAVAMPQNKDLLRQVGFPAGVVPVIPVTSQLIHFLLALPVLGLFLWLDGRPFTFALTALPMVMCVQFLFTLCLAYLVAPLQAMFHDTEHLLRLFLMLLFYVSGVFYDPAVVPREYLFVYNLNPLVHLLGAYRGALIQGESPAVAPLFVVAVVSGLTLVAAYHYYCRLHYRLLQEL
jgi:lipopolysaccharide transport system permease protein